MPYSPPAAGGGGSVVFFEEGSAVGTATNLNFVGAGVTATYSGGTATATIPGGTALGSIVFLDEGVTAGTATHLNVVGSSGTVAYSGGTATLTLSGGSSLTQVPSITWGITGTGQAYITAIVECLGTGTLTAKCRLNQTGSAAFVNLFQNGARIQQQTSSAGTATYTFTGVSVAAGDQFYIAVSNGGVVVPLRIADAFDLSSGLLVVGMPTAGMLFV